MYEEGEKRRGERAEKEVNGEVEERRRKKKRKDEGTSR